MTLDIRRLARAVLFGALVGAGAVFLRANLQPVLGDQLPFMVALLATMLASVLWGSVAGLIAAVICAAAIALPGIPPDLAPLNRPLQIGGFLVEGAVIALLCGQLSRSRRVLSNESPEFETPLAVWLRAVLWGAFLVPFIVFLVLSWWGYERAQREAEATVTHASELAYGHAKRIFNVTLDIATRAASAVSGDDESVHDREAEIHQRFADMTIGAPSVVNLNVWDASGRPLARSDIYPVDPKANVSDRAYFQEQRTRLKGLGVSDVIKGRQTGRELTNATIARTSSDGSFRGVVAVSLAPQVFRDYYRSLVDEQSNLASFALIRTDGELIARWPPTTDGRTHVPANSPILKAIRAGQSAGTVDIAESAGREARITSFRRLEDFPLYVVAGVSREAVFVSWTRFVALLAAVLLPTSAGLAYVSWVALKKTQREAAIAAELQEQIRRRANAEQSAMQSQKLETLAVVTGGVAHDFNNLLAIVNASLHIIKRSHPELSKEKQVQAMTRAIQTGVRLTRQLLSFTRKQALRPETVELQSWLPSLEGLIQTTLGHTISWQVRIESDTRAVHVDTGELELALINLVVNARHAMPQGGALTVLASNLVPSTSSERSMVSVSVSDTGVGIPTNLLTKVFEPFFTTRTKGAGSGLGLSQVQGFCTEAGGAVRIESVVGSGTTVSMVLPACAGTALSAPAEVAFSAQIRGKLLLVEDNEDVGATTELMLRAAGLEVTRKANADAALAHLSSTAATLPDVVLSDISMPGSMDGIQLAFALKERFPQLPVLLTTGYAEQLDQAVIGGFKVLAKPVAPEELLTELRTALGTGIA
jgi:two-component system NtrC family sensor kinase